MKKAVQYYKVVDTKNGHYGYFYKLGLNKDPLNIPLKDVRSCGPGAFYFTTQEHLSGWGRTGDSIAWITPISTVKKDHNEAGIKWKAQTIKVTKILSIGEALPLLKSLTLEDYDNFGVTMSQKVVLESSLALADKFEWLIDNSKPLMKFLEDNKDNNKFISWVAQTDFQWEIFELRAILKMGLEKIIGRDGLDNVIMENNWKLLHQLIELNPKKYLSMLM